MGETTELDISSLNSDTIDEIPDRPSSAQRHQKPIAMKNFHRVKDSSRKFRNIAPKTVFSKDSSLNADVGVKGGRLTSGRRSNFSSRKATVTYATNKDMEVGSGSPNPYRDDQHANLASAVDVKWTLKGFREGESTSILRNQPGTAKFKTSSTAARIKKVHDQLKVNFDLGPSQ